jgi:hypothetical protein
MQELAKEQKHWMGVLEGAECERYPDFFCPLSELAILLSKSDAFTYTISRACMLTHFISLSLFRSNLNPPRDTDTHFTLIPSQTPPLTSLLTLANY